MSCLLSIFPSALSLLSPSAILFCSSGRRCWYLCLANLSRYNMSSLILLLLVFTFSLPLVNACDGGNLAANAAYSSCSHSTKDMEQVRLDRENISSGAESPNGSEDEEGNSIRCKGQKETVSGAAPPMPAVLVNSLWRMPVRRGGLREHPGFDVDYIGPRTHPPIHN